MNKTQAVLIVLYLLGAGVGVTLRRLWVLSEKASFASEYLKRYQALLEAYVADRFDHEAFTWLNLNVVRMQIDLGSLGVVSYRPPFSDYVVHGYQMLINTLSEMRDHKAHHSNLGAVEEALIRRIGVLQELHRQEVKGLKNPLVWLREGIRWTLLLPLFLLRSFGLMSEGTTSRVAGSYAFKLIAFIVAAIGFLSAVLDITLGWEEFSRLLHGWGF